MSGAALDFCSALFGTAPEGLHTLLWTRQDKQSHWVSLGDGGIAVAERAEALARSSMDVYVSVSASASRGKSSSRISSKDSAGIMGLWADVDIADPDVHKKFNLPPDEESATDLLDRAGLPPTLLVHSGHGLQAWWLFNEFWAFEDESERRAAADLAEKWNTTLRIRAAERDWTVDSTFDLARVMRVPGTENHKKNDPSPVRLLNDSGIRYNPDDFAGFFVDEGILAERGMRPVRTYVVGDLELTEGNKVDSELLDTLRDNLDNFADTWDRKRKDFRDQSGSTYDLSIASMAAHAGCTDMEIAALLLSHRRKHKDNPEKALRTDYVRRTISKARDGEAREQAAEVMDDAVHELREVRGTGDDEKIRTARRGTLETISQQIGVEIIRFVKYTSEPPTYRMVTPTHSVDLGDVNGILTWSKFQASVAAATDHMIGRFKTSAWDQVAQAILDSAEHEDVGIEATQSGQIYVWLSNYLMQQPAISDVGEALQSESAYLENGAVHIFGGTFRRWLWLSQGERVTAREVGKLLRVYGAVPTRVNMTLDGQRTSRSAWRLPPKDQQ